MMLAWSNPDKKYHQLQIQDEASRGTEMMLGFWDEDEGPSRSLFGKFFRRE